MNKKHLISLITLLLILCCGSFFFWWEHSPSRRNTQVLLNPTQLSNFPFYSIHEINSNQFKSGSYRTEGYVAKIYTCPPCPPKELCKACMEEHIIISEKDTSLEKYSLLSDSEIIVFTNNPNSFTLGKKYNFSIKILDSKSTDTSINNIKLLEYSL